MLASIHIDSVKITVSAGHKVFRSFPNQLLRTDDSEFEQAKNILANLLDNVIPAVVADVHITELDRQKGDDLDLLMQIFERTIEE